PSAPAPVEARRVEVLLLVLAGVELLPRNVRGRVPGAAIAGIPEIPDVLKLGLQVEREALLLEIEDTLRPIGRLGLHLIHVCPIPRARGPLRIDRRYSHLYPRAAT